jgi:mono/diheme cytochrome c family protein/rhodanese-related sulfurtransferase
MLSSKKTPGKFLFLFTLILFTTTLYDCSNIEEKETFLLGQGTGINSATMMVQEMDSAIHYFEDTLGFNIRWGAQSGVFNGTVGTSISFGDMTTLELLSTNDTLPEENAIGFVAEYLDQHSGMRLFSLSTSDIDSTRMNLVSAGFSMDSVRSYRSSSRQPSGWSRDDGTAQRRSLDFNATNPPAQLPRFIQKLGTDYAATNKDWNTYYIYRRMFNEHPNGVLGISAIKVAVADLKKAAKDYEKMGLQLIREREDHMAFKIFRHQELHLYRPDQNPSVEKFFKERVNGVFAIQFDVDNLDSTYQFFKEELPEEAMTMEAGVLSISPSYAFGVRMDFVQEPEDQKLLVRRLEPKEELDSLAKQHAAALYTKYCALCHGENREGYAADNAPSLKSHSLLATSKYNNFMRYAIQFGRGQSAMAGYLNSQGGPMEYIEIELLLEWLYQMAEVEEPIRVSREPVIGDIELGSKLYLEHCATCHGAKGEGISAPALANPMLLATATDHFLRYAIAEGRDGTPMVGFKDQLDSLQINALTAYLRSRASGWDVPKPDSVKVPTPDEYVLNPENDAPIFELREGMFVSSEQVNKALQDSLRMIILDARSEVAWRQMHIPGAIPVPYYEDPENFINDIPNDGTQIVIYCACPHAASKRVMSTLNRNGFKNTAIIDEGILVWAEMGFPVRSGS